nr:rRNA adenine N-6-methyltransferase family protein [Rhizobium leguminosarum]
MTKEISPLTGPVLELGPGTGVFTAALLERGIAERDLTLVEYERDFATLLQDRFPDARVLPLDVRQMWKTALSRSFFGGVVSGLPLLAMRPDDVRRCSRAAFPTLDRTVPSISSPTDRNARCPSKSSTPSALSPRGSAGRCAISRRPRSIGSAAGTSP